MRHFVLPLVFGLAAVPLTHPQAGVAEHVRPTASTPSIADGGAVIVRSSPATEPQSRDDGELVDTLRSLRGELTALRGELDGLRSALRARRTAPSAAAGRLRPVPAPQVRERVHLFRQEAAERAERTETERAARAGRTYTVAPSGSNSIYIQIECCCHGQCSASAPRARAPQHDMHVEEHEAPVFESFELPELPEVPEAPEAPERPAQPEAPGDVGRAPHIFYLPPPGAHEAGRTVNETHTPRAVSVPHDLRQNTTVH